MFHSGNFRKIRRASFRTNNAESVLYWGLPCAALFAGTVTNIKILETLTIRLMLTKQTRHFFLKNVTKYNKKPVMSLELNSAVVQPRSCLNFFTKFSNRLLLNKNFALKRFFCEKFTKMRSTAYLNFWNNLRSIRRLKLLPNLRKEGLMPRFESTQASKKRFQSNSRQRYPYLRKGHTANFKFNAVGRASFNPWPGVKNSDFRNNLMPSIFDRNNFISMQLIFETVRPRFRYTRVANF